MPGNGWPTYARSTIFDHAPAHDHTRRVNLTDPTSRIMKGKQGLAWIQANNLTITVARRYQIILAGRLYDCVNDQGGLHPSLDQARTNCDQAGITAPMRAHLADAGYASTATFTTPVPGILLVSTQKEAAQTGRVSPTQPARRSHQQMASRLANPAGARLYRRRAGKVEPVFAHMFHHGGRNLHHRGQATHAEVTIMITTHNAGKYLTDLAGRPASTDRPHPNTPKHRDP
jgi:hypothetical protein